MKKLAVIFVFALSMSVHATEKSSVKSLSGTWRKETNSGSVTFTFNKKELTCKLVVDGSDIELQASYGITTEGILFGIVTNLKKDDTGQGPAKGTLFSFQLSKSDQGLTLSNFKPDDGEGKTLLEGLYKSTK